MARAHRMPWTGDDSDARSQHKRLVFHWCSCYSSILLHPFIMELIPFGACTQDATDGDDSEVEGSEGSALSDAPGEGQGGSDEERALAPQRTSKKKAQVIGNRVVNSLRDKMTEMQRRAHVNF